VLQRHQRGHGATPATQLEVSCRLMLLLSCWIN
jgi:hypothetical protein